MGKARILYLLMLVAIVAEAHNSRSRMRNRKVGSKKLEQVFAWKQVEFENGGLAGQNSTVFDLPMGIERWNDKLFLGFPRRRTGVPATLNVVSLSETAGKSPIVRPYPDQQTNDLNTTSPIVSVSRPKVDSCDRLWVMDTGVVAIKGVSNQMKPPQIVIIDLHTDKIIKRHELKNIRDGSGMVSTTVDIPGGDCANAFAYIPDLNDNSVTVYSLKEDADWRVHHNLFHMDPEEGDFELNGLKFQWDDGVFSIALGQEQEDGYRSVYFHAMASFSERVVSSAVLRNQTLATRAYHGDDFKTIGTRGPNSQTNIHAVDQESGIMFSTQPCTSSLHCWRTDAPLDVGHIGIVAQDDELLFYPSDMKLDSEGNVWVLSNKFPAFLYSTLDADKENFRVFRVPVEEAIKGTVCSR